jgi:membrane associated rhomboid family serine protease
MKYNQEKNVKSNRTVGVSERTTPAVLTLLLDAMILVSYYSYQSSGGASWIMRNVFQLEQVLNLINAQKYSQLFSMLYNSNFVNVSVWQLLLSIYFVSLFGIPVEKRLGPMRFIMLILVCCTLPWLVQFIDLSYCPFWPVPYNHPQHDLFFFGPFSIILGLAGAYNVLMPKRAVDMSHSRLHRKDRTEIFNRTQAKAMNEKYGFSPSFFFSMVMLYVVGSHYVTAYFYSNYDNIGLFAGLVSLACGYIIASFIHIGLEESYQEHPLKHSAIKHYYELVDLDVGHANAVKGAAKTLGLPDYQVEDWVKKTKGKLRPT